MKPSASLAPSFAGLVQEFFVQRLRAQRNASPCTIASYRDAFRLLFQFTQSTLGKSPTMLGLDLHSALLKSVCGEFISRAFCKLADRARG